MSRELRSVVFVLANGGRGGMQSQVRLVASDLASRGVNVTLAVGGGDLDLTDGVHVVTLPTFSPRRPLPFVRALRTVAKRHDADVVHGHGLRLAPLLRLSGVHPRVVTCHGLDPARAAGAARAVRHSATPVVSCGEGPRSQLSRYGVRSRVINNALGPQSSPHSRDELNERFNLSPHRPAVIWPARFSEQKNHAELLRALTLVRNQLGDNSPEVLCFGDGPLRETIENAANRAGDTPLIRCFDYLPDASSWLSATDFFLLPSLWEGQPLVVLEALARGVAVASMAPVGTDDLILDGHNGRRVANATELAHVIVQWCTAPASRPRDDTFTNALLATHALDVVVAAHLELYEELLA